jgi:hypothetical protein
MQNNRNLIVLAVVLAVLGTLYVLTRDRRPDLDTTGGFVDLVPGLLTTDDVHSVRVSLGGRDDAALQIVQQSGAWSVPSHFGAPANLNKIRTLLGNLESVTGEVRSDDAGVLAAYALDDSNAYHLSVRDEGGTAMVELLIGKQSSNGCFVRTPGSNRVLSTDHNFLTDLGIWGDDRTAPAASQWIDLVAYQVDRAKVRSLELRGEQGVTLVKELEEPAPVQAEVDTTGVPMAQPGEPDPEAYEWRVTSPSNFVASRSRADGILNSLATLRARDVVATGEVDEEYGLGEGASRVIVTLDDGTSQVLLFGAALPDDANAFYFRVEGQPLVWSMPGYLKSNVFKTVDDLKVQ